MGKNFISKKFKQYASTIGINIKGVLVKAYNSISIVKRYYPLYCHLRPINCGPCAPINKLHS